MTWKPLTLKDFRHQAIRMANGIAENQDIPDEQLPDATAVCQCGKVTVHTMIFDVRNLSKATRADAKIADGVDFLCDGCLETIFREGRVAHHDFMQDLGADPTAHELWKDYVRAYPYPHGSRAHEKKVKDKLHLPK